MARFSLYAVMAVTMAAVTTGFAPKISSPNNALTASRVPTSLGVAIDTSDIKNGLTVELDGEPWKVLNFSIMKQARGAAKTTIKFKNLIKGNTIENTYRSGEKFETAMIEKSDHQYTYQDGVSERSNLGASEKGNFFKVFGSSTLPNDVQYRLNERTKPFFTIRSFSFLTTFPFSNARTPSFS
jgi:hypothetical protein